MTCYKERKYFSFAKILNVLINSFGHTLMKTGDLNPRNELIAILCTSILSVPSMNGGEPYKHNTSGPPAGLQRLAATVEASQPSATGWHSGPPEAGLR